MKHTYIFTLRLRTNPDRTGTEQAQNEQRTGRWTRTRTEQAQNRHRIDTEQAQNRHRTGTE